MSAEPYALGAERTGVFGHARGLTPAMAGFATVAGIAWVNGGYFATSWGIATVALLVVAAGALAFGRRVSLTRADGLFLGSLCALLGWTALSAVWSRSLPGTVLEVERTLVYVSAGLALLLVARRETAGRLLGGALAGITFVAGYASATRLFPESVGSFDPVAGYRLAAPLGYWNGLGLYCAMGMLLALGLSARHRVRQLRALAAGTLPLLAVTLYFTFSRGAGIAFAVGLGAMLLIGRNRLRLAATVAVLAPASALAVLLASRAKALTHEGTVLTAATQEGHRLAPALALLVLASGVSVLGLAALQRRIRVRSRVRRTIGIALVVLVVVVVADGVVAAGGPGSVAHRIGSGFTAPPTKDGNLNKRVLTLSSDGRVGIWRAAWQDTSSSPLLGSGAGSFEQFFYEHRETASLNVRDAHSLYLETLAELGPVGLVVLVLGLGLPLVAAFRSRGDSVSVAATGAYVAFLFHAGWDWDWELPAVTLTALLAAAVLLARARGRGTERRLSGRVRLALAAALVVPAAFAAVTAVGNRADSKAQKAAIAGEWSQAAAQARLAHRLAPWASQPLRTLAQSRMAAGDFAGATRDLNKAIRLDPKNWALWFDLAQVSDGAAQAAALDRARSLNPFNPDFQTS